MASREGVKDLLEAIYDRADKASNKAEMLEERAMFSNLMIDEFLRLVRSYCEQWDHLEDPSWLPRQVRKAVTALLRSMFAAGFQEEVACLRTIQCILKFVFLEAWYFGDARYLDGARFP